MVRQKENPYGKVDAEIDRVNKKYLQALPILLCRVDGSLYVRGTFPPRSGELKPFQHRLPLKLKAHVDNLYDARIAAQEVGTDLLLGKWQWPQTIAIESNIPRTVADFAKLHLERYLNKNGDTLDKRAYWKKDFGYPFDRLVQDKSPNPELCRRIIEDYGVQTRARQRYVKAYRQLLQLAGLSESAIAQIAVMRGSYQAERVDPRDIPEVETVIEWYHRVPDRWQFFYFMLACFGLRGTEVHRTNCRLENIDRGEITAYGDKGKKWRFVPTCSQKMFKLMLCKPQWNRDDRSPGQLSDDFGKMIFDLGCPFVPYDLRHHYAYYTLLQGWEVALSARYMGHSMQMHCEVYLNCIDAVRERKLLEINREERERW